jgi:hypothetical protein
VSTLSNKIDFRPTFLASNLPTLTVIWPQDGILVSGSQFTFEGQVDDPTATIMASVNAPGRPWFFFIGHQRAIGGLPEPHELG